MFVAAGETEERQVYKVAAATRSLERVEPFELDGAQRGIRYAEEFAGSSNCI